MSKYKKIIDIMNRINVSENYSNLLSTIIDSAKELVNCEGASLLLIDEEKDELIFDIVLSTKGEIIRGRRIKIGVGIAGFVASTGETLLCNNPREDSRFFDEIDIASGFETRNIIAVPVKSKHKIIGVLEAVNCKLTRGFVETDLIMLSYLSDAVGISLSNHELVLNLKNRVDELTCIYEISQSIYFTFDIRELLKKILFAVNKVIRAEKCSFLILDEETKTIKYFVSTQETQYDIDLENSLMAHVLKSGDPLLVYNVDENKRIVHMKNNIRYKTNSFICVPVTLRDKVIGVLNVTDKSTGDIFDSFDLRILSTVANHVALTYENIVLEQKALEQKLYNEELKIAEKIQNQTLSLIPDELKGCNIGAFTIPASYVGGDFFEITRYSSTEIGVSVGDVSGKGVPAAIFMSNVRACLRYESAKNYLPEFIMSQVNKRIYQEANNGMFCTLFYSFIDLEKRVIRYCSAGHDEQVVYNPKTGGVVYLKTRGKPFGITENPDYEVKSYHFESGEYLILFSDGLIEQNQARAIELIDIIRYIYSNPSHHAESIVALVREEYENRLKDYNADDDSTLVIIQFD